MGNVCVCRELGCAGDTNTNDVCGEQHSLQKSNGILLVSEMKMSKETAVKSIPLRLQVHDSGCVSLDQHLPPSK